MKSILKFFIFIFTLTLVISCNNGDDYDSNDIGTTSPGKSTLLAPENNKTCETLKVKLNLHGLSL